MTKDLAGKTALVTGAGKKTGIGYAIARRLVGDGVGVIIADLGREITTGPETSTADDNEVEITTRTRGWDTCETEASAGPGVPTATAVECRVIAAELQDEFGVRTLPVAVDVTDNASIQQMVAQIRGAGFDTVDILCNNAGASFGVPNAVHTYNEAAWLATIDVNLHSVFRVSRAVLPLMIEKGGVIINTASRAGKVPPLFNGAYAVAKAGVIMLTKVMALELAANRIRVNAICPGQIMTDLERWRFELEAQFLNTTAAEREAEMCKTIPLNRIGSAAEVADLVAFLASEASAYMTGQAINITGGQLMEL
jgi:NAD(P)-dependent dehydrogenase (short-subunit alcohol dehydrogenase family)